ncbi:PREDICTED: protein slit-like [Branchiostoma belcheri]|uniref:Protein slit-like n=1 Tax=Branchiostoma belcheri TaxID=7741 RepID=A0A6P4Y6E2_BRABE|nr:PREDICTED: protein slit-like [Branchiostoma belcheri]
MPRWSKYWLVVFVASFVSSRVSTCPVGCTCTEYLVDLNVACSGNGSTSLRNKLPPDTTFLTLTGYRLPVLNLNVLGGLKKLRGLKLPSNEITQIEGTLEVFPRLYELDLSRNKFTSVSPRTFGNATTRLGYVDLSENPFDCDSECGGIQLNSLCDCSVNTFNCTCNILWLKQQVKHWGPSVWMGVRCQVPKDKDIRTVDIRDYWCKRKLCWISGIPIISLAVILIIAAIVYICKKRNRYTLLGTDPVTKQLIKLSGKLGMEWESLATHLGFTRAEVDEFIRNNDRNMRGQIRAMLLSWRNKNGEQATLATLVELLKSYEPPLDTEIYQFLEVSSPIN